MFARLFSKETDTVKNNVAKLPFLHVLNASFQTFTLFTSKHRSENN